MGRWSHRSNGRVDGKGSGSLGRRLAEEELSLARVVLGGADSLVPSSSLEGDEASRLLSFWRSAPLGCIRSMNQAIGLLNDASWTRRYIEAAVDLEILMDRAVGPSAPADVPNASYLQDGRTVTVGSVFGRSRVEMLGVDKERLRPRLVESREQALALAATEVLLRVYYEAVIEDLERDPASVQFPAFATDDERVAVALYLEEGVRLSRRLALRYQLCLQEAGVSSCLVEGTMQLFGTRVQHAWNLAWLDCRVALVDVTLPGIDGPLILVGASPEEVYREAVHFDRLYVPADSFVSYTVAIDAGDAESSIDPPRERPRAADA